MTALSPLARIEVEQSQMRYVLYGIPLLVAVAIGAFFYFGLGGNPRNLPSAFIDKPAPAFNLVALPGRTLGPHGDPGGLSTADLKVGKPVIVNVWASWCIPCVAEHPLVDRLATKEGYTVHGINYADKAGDGAGWLKRLGDPYAKVGFDIDRKAGIEWGVYGVPETFIVDGEGIVRFKHAGALTPDLLEKTILPLLKELQ